MEPIRLSALGRDVALGDLYNYHTDNILKSKLVVHQSSNLLTCHNVVCKAPFILEAGKHGNKLKVWLA